ncbi:MAG: hypothetical protein ACJ8C4_16440 [Gemmataceae bacterium]
MNESEPMPATPQIGHVKNGVVVLDAPGALPEGQTVRVEPVPEAEAKVEAERRDRIQQLQQLFDEWTDEDGKLTDEEANRLRVALDDSRGLHFRPANV